jgi:hypothetical protein
MQPPAVHRFEPREEAVRVPPVPVAIHAQAVTPRGRPRSVAPMIGCSMPAVPRLLPGAAPADTLPAIPAFLRAR